MIVILNDTVSTEIKEYLLTQDGITNVQLKQDDYKNIIDIKYNEKITPEIIMKFIELFQENKYSVLIGFDKKQDIKCNKIIYHIDDLCCEYCYMGLIEDLFENKYIKSVYSNYDYFKLPINLELQIEYYDNYSEEKVIDFIKERI